MFSRFRFKRSPRDFWSILSFFLETVEVCPDPEFADGFIEEEDADEVPGAEGFGNFTTGFVLSLLSCSGTVVSCFPEGSDERNDDVCIAFDLKFLHGKRIYL